MSSLSSVSSSGSQLNNLIAPRISINGLASGLDSDQIIEGLLAIQQKQIENLQTRQDRIANQQAAFKGIEARLLALQGSVAQLGRSQNGAFDLRSAASSNEDLLTAAASGSAAPGVYTFKVNALARAHQIVSQGFGSSTSPITQGTLQIGGGSGSTTTITIDGTNNTLDGLAAAINSAGAGVQATVIQDGSATQPYRLLLTSDKSGAANAITITNNLGPDGGGAVQPTFNTTVQEAADASVTLGSGAGALTVLSATNEVDSVIPGLTLNLLEADPTKTATVTVAVDAEKAKTAILDFVEGFNELMKFIDEQVRFDANTGQAGLLQANRQATAIQDQLRAALGSRINGVNPQMNRLGALGITFDDKGQLQVNQGKLDDALGGRVAGVTFQDVRSLFALSGTSTSAGVQFVTGSTKTKASTTPYQVDLTQAAEQAVVTATSTLSASTVIDGTNNSLTLTVDGVASGAITLASGTYTMQELAKEVQDQINADDTLIGRQVAVGLNGDRLTITSVSYGSSSEVKIGSGTALAPLGFAGTETGQGRDVVGKFIVNGQDEPAVGKGQFLSGNSGNANTGDLQVRVLLTPTQIVSGPEADLTVTRGIASVVDVALNGLLDPVNGRLKTIDDGFQTTVDGLKEQAERRVAAMESRRAALVQQFIAMERAVSQLQSISNFLSSQLTALNQLQLRRR